MYESVSNRCVNVLCVWECEVVLLLRLAAESKVEMAGTFFSSIFFVYKFVCVFFLVFFF